MNLKYSLIAVSAMAFLSACGQKYEGNDAFQVEPLKDILAPIKVGAAIDNWTLRSEENMKMFSYHFNSATCENSMKPIETERTQGVFTYETPDKVTDFVLSNKGAVMRGHCLIWHSQCPAWLTEDSTQVFQRMKEHIFAVMEHYKGKVYCYDVVNEAIDDGGGFLRNSQWLKVAGEHFIDSAFVYAHQADPDALLFYNDYGLNNPAKREKCYKLVKGMLERGIPIHGIGMQGHYNVNMDYNTVDESLTRFEELGVLIQFTELDIAGGGPRRQMAQGQRQQRPQGQMGQGQQGQRPQGQQGQRPQGQQGQRPQGQQGQQGQGQQGQVDQMAGFGGYSGNGGLAMPELTEEEKAHQDSLVTEAYKKFFAVVKKHKKSIHTITFWGLTDNYSWLNSRSRQNAPFLFDGEYKAKPAYFAVKELWRSKDK
ncbi:MAG: endo-1,4-beta-xylanase [Bacteroidaceae bacterium]|nr:endo-1,4-beta-xylanase [Bacteroidaceae bacterium]